MKVTIIGAGSSYTPELVEGFLRRRESFPLSRLCLMDIDSSRLMTVAGFVSRIFAARGSAVHVEPTGNLEEALAGADYVLTQFRVGKLDARIRDEKIPLRHGLIGQETTGIGGFLKALRTIPVMEDIARRMERLCPKARLVNFTNPSGIVTQYLLSRTAVKAVGLCNIPINMRADIARALGCTPERLEIDYVGLNHLSWVIGARVDGVEAMDGLLGSGYSGLKLKNVPDFGFDGDLIRAAGGIPCAYLQYFYRRGREFEELAAKKLSRGEECKAVEAELMRIYADPSRTSVPPELGQRGGSLYSEAAVSLIDSIHNDRRDVQVVDALNGGALDFLEAGDVVELPCVVSADGPKPVKPRLPINAHIRGMMSAIKAYERLTVDAALSGDRDLALAALLTNPLAADYDRARECLDEMLSANADFLPRFFPGKGA